MRYPGPVVTGIHLPNLVQPDLVERLGVGRGVPLDRNLRRHPAHRVNAAAMTGPDQQVDVGLEEVPVHRDARAIGQYKLRPAAELLDEAEDVVPAPAVESRRVLAQ